jgi:PAT family beta-lactamase induction signal transducer AmpG
MATVGKPEAAASARPARRKRTLMELIRAMRQPRMAIMAVLGFSSGLPFMMIGNTLGYWLADDGISKAAIGYLSWAGLAFLWKFIWGAVVDNVPVPWLRKFGRRRGWMMLTMTVIGVGMVGMAVVGSHNLPMLALFAVITGIGAAAQDTVIDAWRIEIAESEDELGLLTSVYSLGYRIALFATEALILLLATWIGWAVSYAIYGFAMGIGVIAALMAKEPARAIEASVVKVAGVQAAMGRGWAAVAGPFGAFFRSHGVATAVLMLLFITLYHLCDYLRGPMSNPYYVALGLDKPTVAAVRAGIGLPMTFVGIAVGGILSVRIGNKPTLILGAILQPVAVGLFALLGLHGGDFHVFGGITAFPLIMGFDSFCMALSGIALIGYMSTLTSLGYTATQYALLTSAMAWSGKILKGFSGDIVERLQVGHTELQAFATFYLLAAAIGIPALVLSLVLRPGQAQQRNYAPAVAPEATEDKPA